MPDFPDLPNGKDALFFGIGVLVLFIFTQIVPIRTFAIISFIIMMIITIFCIIGCIAKEIYEFIIRKRIKRLDKLSIYSLSDEIFYKYRAGCNAPLEALLSNCGQRIDKTRFDTDKLYWHCEACEQKYSTLKFRRYEHKKQIQDC